MCDSFDDLGRSTEMELFRFGGDSSGFFFDFSRLRHDFFLIWGGFFVFATCFFAVAVALRIADGSQHGVVVF